MNFKEYQKAKRAEIYIINIYIIMDHNPKG